MFGSDLMNSYKSAQSLFVTFENMAIGGKIRVVDKTICLVPS